MEVLDAVAVASGRTEIASTAGALGSGVRHDFTVRNVGRETLTLERVEIRIAASPELVIEQGYQSWSPTWIRRPGDVRRKRAEAPDWILGTNFADPDTAKSAVVGDQVLVTTDGVIGWLGAGHFGTVAAWPGGGVSAIALLDGIEIEPGAERHLEPLWVAAGNPGPLYSEFAAAWGAESGARAGANTPFGWCSWYEFFGEVAPEDIRRNLRIASSNEIELVQIDDGYQGAIGDWLSLNERWASVGSMKEIASEISAAGCEAGIWTAPFLAAENSALFDDHPEWISAHPPTGKPSKAMYNPAWGGWALALDTTNPAVLDHLRETFSTLRAWGFDYHKVDFCYSASLAAIRHDPTKTRAEALRLGLEAVREGIGDDAFLLGCGCPFGPAVGVVDAMRVSPDVAPYWEERAVWPGLEGSGVAAENAVRASHLRAPLHRRLFANDPDCVLLRPTNTELTAEQRRALADAVLETGAFVVLSDDMARYGDGEWAEVRRLRAERLRLDKPLDLVDPFADR